MPVQFPKTQTAASLILAALTLSSLAAAASDPIGSIVFVQLNTDSAAESDPESDTDTDTDEETDFETDEETSPDTPATTAPGAPPPGMARAMLAGRPVSIPVACSGFGRVGEVEVRSDPDAPRGVDGNEDGTLLEVQANRSTGAITVEILANDESYSFATNGAEVLDNGLTFEVSIVYVGGATERFTLTVNCNG